MLNNVKIDLELFRQNAEFALIRQTVLPPENKDVLTIELRNPTILGKFLKCFIILYVSARLNFLFSQLRATNLRRPDWITSNRNWIRNRPATFFDRATWGTLEKRKFFVQRRITNNNISKNIYYFKRRAINYSSGLTSINVSNLCTGQIPSLMIFVLMAGEQTRGNVKLNPYEFKHFLLNEITLHVNSETIPSIPIRYNFGNDRVSFFLKKFYTYIWIVHIHFKLDRATNSQVARGYNFMLDQLGVTSDRTNGLTVKDFSNGFTAFCFDLTPDRSAGESHFSRLQTGTLWCDLKFDQPLPTEVTLLYYMEFEKLALIDSFRNIALSGDA